MHGISKLSSVVGVIDIPKEYFQKKIEQRKDQYVWTCTVMCLCMCTYATFSSHMCQENYHLAYEFYLITLWKGCAIPGKTFPVSHKNIPCKSLHFRCSNIVESDRTIHKTSSKLTPVNLRSSLDMSWIRIIIKKVPMFPMAIANKKTQTKQIKILNNYNRS
jgi:hypothetical protein